MPRANAPYKIEKGVPLPEKVSRYPFAEMGPGDSFFIPVTSGTVKGANNRVRTAWKAFKAQHGVDGARITCKEYEGAQKGVRVWLLQDAAPATTPPAPKKGPRSIPAASTMLGPQG